MDKNILRWEIGGFFFILFFGSSLHFAFELSNYWYPVGLFAAVNESIWEHLKMVFWPGLLFFIVQYRWLKNTESGGQFWTAKALCLLLMPLWIAAGWYTVVALTGQHHFFVDIALFISAIIVGQLASCLVLSGKIALNLKRRPAVMAILLLAAAFALFTYYPPRIFLFEHKDLENTGLYGVLENPEGLLSFEE